MVRAAARYRRAISDRSFIRFGGVAAILLAVTSWAAVLAYVTVAEGGTHVVGMQIHQLLYALAALWALFGVVAVHALVRPAGEAWSLLAALVGVAASVLTMANALFVVESIRTDVALPDVSPLDPLHLATFGLTALWFVIADVLLWSARVPRQLVLLGFVAALDLGAGFVGALAANAGLVAFASLVAGAVAIPLYWLGLGLVLRRAA